MPKCKNCYHKDICVAFLDGSEMPDCDYFKDKSLIVELPCRVGDTLYIKIDELEKSGGAYIKQEKVVEVSTEGRIWTDDCYYDYEDIGKIIFFTREAAEKSLKGGVENEQR